MQAWLALIVALVLNALANVLMKVGANQGGSQSPDAHIGEKIAGFLNWPTLLAIACFAANILVYRRALESFKVSVAYPIMVSTGLLLVTLAAVAIPALNERVGPVQIIGMVLIAAGVWLVARS